MCHQSTYRTYVMRSARRPQCGSGGGCRGQVQLGSHYENYGNHRGERTFDLELINNKNGNPYKQRQTAISKHFICPIQSNLVASQQATYMARH